MSDVAGQLHKRWRRDTSLFSLAASEKEALFSELCARYSEPHRHYHTLAHIAAVFEVLEEFQSTFAAPHIVTFAVWYHDIVYDTTRKDNEHLSADYEEKDLARLGLPAADRGAVSDLIEATSDHLGAVTNRDGDLFLDADFSILGAPDARYRTYVSDVRKEYQWVPDPLWAEGRLAFLDNAASRSRLFRTDEFETRLGAQARANIAWEQETLRGARP